MAAEGHDDVFRAFEDTGMVLGMHTFLPSFGMAHPLGDEFLFAPGDLFPHAGVDGQTFSFVHEMQSWLAQVLLSGFLDRYDRLKMAIYESNAEWLTVVLENADRVFKLYASERPAKSDRLPSEAFYEQCVIGFESDEISVFRQWKEYEDIGIWASDAYHIDGADAWSAISSMTASGVPERCSGQADGGKCPTVLRHRAEGVHQRGARPDRPSAMVSAGYRARQVGRSCRPSPRERRQAQGAGARLRDPVGQAYGAHAGAPRRDGRRVGPSGRILMAGVVDIDSHVFEPAAVWDDYIPPADRELAIRAFHYRLDREGNEAIVLNGRPARSMNRSKIVRQAVWRPGMRPEDIGRLDPRMFQPLNPGASDPKARLADLDLMGIAQQVVFPTLFGEYLPQVTDPEAAVVLARAYNDWVADFAAAGEGRLYVAAILPMQRPDLALAELERIAAKGLKTVMIRPSFYKLDG